MSYYIGTQQQCEDYNSECVIAHKHIDSTTRWADLIPHPNGIDFAIQKSPVVTSEVMLEAGDLSEDWCTEETI